MTSVIPNISFAHPWCLLLLLLLPIIWMVNSRQRKRAQPAFRMTTLSALQHIRPAFKVRLRKWLFFMRLVALVCIIIALARPQSSSIREQINSEGIDIVLSMDVSGSMLAEDLVPNRIEAAKNVAQEFVRGRPADRIGLVIFSGESFSQTPITIDHQVVLEQIAHISSGVLEDGTAIGMGLATAVDRLRRSDAVSKVVILLTDGVNNTGSLDPRTALEIAKAFQVRVYTIGVGTEGEALYPSPNGGKQMQQVQIDEALLTKIAQQTGGKYYRATNNESLKAVYEEIDQLEKSEVEIDSYKEYTDLFFPFVLIAITLLICELLLRYTYLRSLT